MRNLKYWALHIWRQYATRLLFFASMGFFVGSAMMYIALPIMVQHSVLERSGVEAEATITDRPKPRIVSLEWRDETGDTRTARRVVVSRALSRDLVFARNRERPHRILYHPGNKHVTPAIISDMRDKHAIAMSSFGVGLFAYALCLYNFWLNTKPRETDT